MLTENKIKEELSIAYVMAVAAKESFATEITRVDYDSVDARVTFGGKLAEDSIMFSPELKLQLKATSSPNIIDDEIHFPLPIKNYNDLRNRSMVPRLLVILCLPKDAGQWLSHSTSNLILRECAYWLNLEGMPASNNATSVTVPVPLSNVFSPEKLKEAMVKASKEEKL